MPAMTKWLAAVGAVLALGSCAFVTLDDEPVVTERSTYSRTSTRDYDTPYGRTYKRRDSVYESEMERRSSSKRRSSWSWGDSGDFDYDYSNYDRRFNMLQRNIVKRYQELCEEGEFGSSTRRACRCAVNRIKPDIYEIKTSDDVERNEKELNWKFKRALNSSACDRW